MQGSFIHTQPPYAADYKTRPLVVLSSSHEIKEKNTIHFIMTYAMW